MIKCNIDGTQTTHHQKVNGLTPGHCTLALPLSAICRHIHASVTKLYNLLLASYNYQWKKRSETQTLRPGCGKVEPKIFCTAADPFPGAWDGQNLISWRWSLPLLTNPIWWGSMYAISSYRGNRPTNTQTNTQTRPQTGPITIHCSAAS